MQYDGYLHSYVIIDKKRPDSDKKKRKARKSVAFTIRFPIYCWRNCITALRKIHQDIMQISQNARNELKTCKKALTNHPAVSIIILVSNGATRTQKVRAAPFVLSGIAKVLQYLQRRRGVQIEFFQTRFKKKRHSRSQKITY